MDMHTEQSWPLGESLTLRIPVVQAPLGICDGPRLAGAVSQAGGLGCLTVHATPIIPLRSRLRRVRKITTSPILVALTAEWDREEVLETCLEEGMRHFQVFWWNGPRQTRRIHAAEGHVFWQVGSVGQAVDAVEIGADILIIQGTEAGGPVRSSLPLHQLLTEIRAAIGDKIPLVAGGGLADAYDVASVLSWGANAALLGTRFLVSEEAQAPYNHKVRLAQAKSEDLILDTRPIGDWPCAPRRRLVIPRAKDVSSFLAGKGLSRIREVLPASEIVRALGSALPAQ